MSTAVSKVELKKNESLLLGDQEEGTSSMTSSSDDEGVALLEKEIAFKVRHLVRSLIFSHFQVIALSLIQVSFSFNPLPLPQSLALWP